MAKQNKQTITPPKKGGGLAALMASTGKGLENSVIKTPENNTSLQSVIIETPQNLQQSIVVENEKLQEKKIVKVIKPVPYEVTAIFDNFKPVALPLKPNTVNMSIGQKEFLKKVASAGKMTTKKNITSYSLLNNIINEWIVANQENIDKLLKYYDKNLEL